MNNKLFTPLKLLNRQRQLPRLRRRLLTGFTLFELVVIIVVMVILAIAAATRFYSYDSLKLEATAQKLASDIRYAQQLTSQYNPWTTSSLTEQPDNPCLIAAFCPHNNPNPSALTSCDYPDDADSYHIIPCVQSRTGPIGDISFPPTTVRYVPITDPITGEPLQAFFSGPNAMNEYEGVEISNLSLSTIVVTGGADVISTEICFHGNLAEVESGYWASYFFVSPYRGFFLMGVLGSPPRPLDINLPNGRTGGRIELTYKGKTKTIYIENTTGRISIE